MTDTAKTAYDWAVKSIGCPYVMGGTGQICTVSYRRRGRRSIPLTPAKSPPIAPA